MEQEAASEPQVSYRSQEDVPDEQRRVIRHETYRKYTDFMTKTHSISPREKKAHEKSSPRAGPNVAKKDAPVPKEKSKMNKISKRVVKVSASAKVSLEKGSRSSHVREKPQTDIKTGRSEKNLITRHTDTTLNESTDHNIKKANETSLPGESGKSHKAKIDGHCRDKSASNLSRRSARSSKVPVPKLAAREEAIKGSLDSSHSTSEVIVECPTHVCHSDDASIAQRPSGVVSETLVRFNKGLASHNANTNKPMATVSSMPKVKEVSFAGVSEFPSYVTHLSPKKRRSAHADLDAPLKRARGVVGANGLGKRWIPVLRSRKAKNKILSPDTTSPKSGKSTRIPRPLISAGARRSYISYVRACRRMRELTSHRRNLPNDQYITTEDTDDDVHMADIQKKYRLLAASKSLWPWKVKEGHRPRSKTASSHPSTSDDTSSKEPRAPVSTKKSTEEKPYVKVLPKKSVVKPKSAHLPIISREFFSESLKKSLATRRSVASQLAVHEENRGRAPTPEPVMIGEMTKSDHEVCVKPPDISFNSTYLVGRTTTVDWATEGKGTRHPVAAVDGNVTHPIAMAEYSSAAADDDRNMSNHTKVDSLHKISVTSETTLNKKLPVVHDGPVSKPGSSDIMIDKECFMKEVSESPICSMPKPRNGVKIDIISSPETSNGVDLDKSDERPSASKLNHTGNNDKNVRSPLKEDASVDLYTIIDIDGSTSCDAMQNWESPILATTAVSPVADPLSSEETDTISSRDEMEEAQTELCFDTSTSTAVGAMSEMEFNLTETSIESELLYNLPGTPLPTPIKYSLSACTRSPTVLSNSISPTSDRNCDTECCDVAVQVDGQDAPPSGKGKASNWAKPSFQSTTSLARQATWSLHNGGSKRSKFPRKQSSRLTPWGDEEAEDDGVEDMYLQDILATGTTTRHAGAARRRKTNCCKQLWIHIKRWYRHYKRQHESGLFRNHIKRVEGQFGCGIVSFFVFLRWVILLNLFLAILWLSAVVIPQASHYNYDFMSDDFYLRNVIDGENALARSWMFYGNYENMAGPYPLAMIYFFAIILTYFGGVFVLLSSMAKSIHDQGQVVKDKRYTFSHLIFVGWDYSLSSREAIENLSSTIAHSVRDHISDIEAAKELSSWSRKDWCKVIARRALAWFLTLILIGGGCAAIFYLIGADLVAFFALMGYSPDAESPLVIYSSTFIFMSVNAVVPFCVFKSDRIMRGLSIFFLAPAIAPRELPKLEKYVHGKTELNISIGRVFILRIANLAALVGSLYNKVEQGEQSRCAGTVIGQELYKLVFLDALVQLIGQLIPSLLRYYWSKKKKEFQMPPNVLKIVYRQALIWVGTLVCPVMPLVGLISMILFFLSNYAVVMKTCCPPTKRFNQSRRSTFFMGLLTATLLILIIPISIVIGSNEIINLGETGQDGVFCGPYGNGTMLEVFGQFRTQMNSQSHTLKVILDHLFSTTSLIAIMFIMSAWMYFQKLRITWEADKRRLLQVELDQEREESKHLMKKLHLLADG